MALFIHLVRNDTAIGAARLFRKPPQVVDGHGHLALALRQRLAILQRDQARNFFTPTMQFAGDLVKHFAAPFS